MAVVLEAVAWIKQGSHIIDRIIVPFIRKIWKHCTLNKHGFHPIMSCCMSGEINCAKRTKVELSGVNINWRWFTPNSSFLNPRGTKAIKCDGNHGIIWHSSKLFQNMKRSASEGHGVLPHMRHPVSGARTHKGSTQLQSNARWRGDEGAQRTQQNGLKSASRTPDLWAHR